MITQADVQSYVDNGYLVVPGLIDRAELEQLKADIIRIARGAYPCAELPPAAAEQTDEEVLRGILCIHFPHSVSPVMRDFVRHPKVTAALGQLVAAHLPHWDGRVKCMQSMLFVKPPGLPGQAWHQDEFFIPTRDRSLTGAWIAIDDATIDNGCLWVVPGSHRDGYLWPHRDHGQAPEFDPSPACYGFDESLQVPVEVTAGSVVFFNGYLLHQSRRNRSDIYRRVLVSHYCNSWSLLPWLSAVPAHNVGSADYRGVLPVVGDDPYADKGYIDPPAPGLRPYVPDAVLVADHEGQM